MAGLAVGGTCTGMPLKSPSERGSGAEQGSEQARGGQGQHLPLPVVMHHLFDQAAGIHLQPLLGRAAGLQRLALQGAAAKSMDGGDIGPIELFEGQQQQSPQAIHGPGTLLGQPIQPRPQHGIDAGRIRDRIFGGLGGPLAPFQGGQGLLQPPTDAIAQLRSGRLRVRDHQQPAQAEALLRHQAQHQVGQGKGLAGAGTRLQQPNAAIEGKAVGLKGLQAGTHGVTIGYTVAARIGP